MLLTSLLMCFSLQAVETKVELRQWTLQPQGMSAKAPAVSQNVKLLAAPPASVKARPAGADRWASWKIGSGKNARMLTVACSGVGANAAFWADLDGDGEFKDSERIAAVAARSPNDAARLMRATITVPCAELGSRPLSIQLVRYSNMEARRRHISPDLLWLIPDYGWTGVLAVGESEYPVLMMDSNCDMDVGFSDESDHDSSVRLYVDVNRDNKFGSDEQYNATETIHLGGAAVVVHSIVPNGEKLELASVDPSTPRMRMSKASELGGGGKGYEFAATTVDGRKVRFPNDFKGHIVLLDFWATWCGPCVHEIPNVLAAYRKYHGQGFDVLGVSLDKPKDAAKLQSFTRERGMEWSQIFPGEPIANQWAVTGIPSMFLVDGDTGEILASGKALRGEGNLSRIVGDALMRKAKARADAGPGSKK